METTFINQNSEKNIVEAGQQCMESTIEAIRGWMEYGTDEESCFDSSDEAETFFAEHGDFNEYGLELSYIMPKDDEPGYLCFLMSTGGPGDELRLYYSPGNWANPYYIEYVYLDWFAGAGFDVTGEDWAKWISEYFGECEQPEHCFNAVCEE